MSRSQSTSHAEVRSGSELTYLMLVSVPIGLLVFLLILGTLREGMAAVTVDAQLGRLRSEGLPTNNHEMAESFDKQTSRKLSGDWQDVMAAQHSVSSRFGSLTLPTKNFSELTGPGQTWDAAPIAGAYASESKPIVEKIAQLDEDGLPVWQPVLFDGNFTMLGDLNEARDTERLLANEFRVAVHQGDQERAMVAQNAIIKVADSFHWPIGRVSQFVNISFRSNHRRLIRQSLAFDFWRIEDLERLKTQLRSSAMDEKSWHDANGFETAMGLEYLDADHLFRPNTNRNVSLFGVSSTAIARYLGVMQQFRELADSDNLSDLRTARQFDRSRRQGISGYSIIGLPLADSDYLIQPVMSPFEVIAGVMVRNQRDRRWTLTAVAIKEFQLRQNRSPLRLDELTQVGLARSDWMASSNEPFGYLVKDGHVLLWTPELTETGSDAPVSTQPPSSDDYSAEVLEDMLIAIPRPANE